MNKSLLSSCIFVVVFGVSGCATIVGDPTQPIPIYSIPSDANILVTDEKGMEVFRGTTPTTVTLQKSDGSYWGKKSYVIRISKDGFETESIQVTALANGWYTIGNLAFSQAIGWFIVDPFSGHMYDLSPEVVNASMLSKTAQNNNTADGSLSAMPIEVVPDTSPELPSEAQRIKIEHPYMQWSTSSSPGPIMPAWTNKLSVGADLTERFGVEGGGIWFAFYEARYADAGYLSLTAKQVIAKNTTLIGKFGLTHYSDEDCHSNINNGNCPIEVGNGVMLGGEIEYDLSEHFAIAIALEYYGGISISKGMLGLRFTF